MDPDSVGLGQSPFCRRVPGMGFSLEVKVLVEGDHTDQREAQGQSG